ncbi:MAG: rfaE bifunctional protein kinase chain/domain [Flavobacteriales bacterium]
MSTSEINQLFQKFEHMNAWVIGDVMIDAYYWGHVNRISPEAPVPVVEVSEKDERLGGAANVALNMLALGATPLILSVVGKDEKGEVIQRLLDKRGFSNEGILASTERPTTVKTRVISGGQHMMRVDEETTAALSVKEESAFIELVIQLFETHTPDVIVLEDYNKGVLTGKVISTVIAEANSRGIPTTVDPKKDNFFSYKDCSLFKPNLKELREGTKIDFDKNDTQALLGAISAMEAKLNNGLSLVTLSELGVLIKQGNEHFAIPAHRREIVDVSGAGDTVISVASLALAAGANPKLIAGLSNLAGGMVCEKTGVVPIDKDKLKAEAERL